MARQNGIEKTGRLRRAARRITALLALAAAGAACAALPALVSGAGTSQDSKRMVGSGEHALAPSVDVRHAFDIRCDAAGTRQKLNVRWERDNRFRLTRLTSVTCINDLNIGTGEPAAGFDTLMGRGKGRYNGRRGAAIEFRFTDVGVRDDAYIRVRDPSGATALHIDGKLDGGDHQAR